jgi:lipopolysaccharide/colanic/teichoic acid biosynthesis glycosyltransferase
MKRVFDLFASIVSLFILLPVFIIVSFVIVVDNYGPVFYKQQRVGLRGRVFGMYKFRSMRVDADKIGPYFTTESDSRITRTGKWIRRLSVDELPQLINVLFGQMSVVGPRPNVFQQKELYEPEAWSKRNSVLPGITGLAQATKRSEASEKERELLDLKYVDEQSFFMDMNIIIMTVKQIISKGGN